MIRESGLLPISNNVLMVCFLGSAMGDLDFYLFVFYGVFREHEWHRYA